MYLSPEAQRLLAEIQRSHEQLIAHFDADESHRRALRAVYEALESAIGDLDEARFTTSVDGQWPPDRVLVHVAEHDQQIEEATRRGIEHMIEHGLDHARDLWLARVPLPAADTGGP